MLGRRPIRAWNRRYRPARARAADRHGGAFRSDQSLGVLRQTGRDGARSVLRRQGAGARRLHLLRRLHDRLPPQRKNSLDKNYLYLAEKLGAVIQPSPWSPTCARWRRPMAPTATPCTGSPAPRAGARAARCAAAASYSRRRAGTVQLLLRLKAGLAAAPVGPSRLRRAHQLRGADPGDRARWQVGVLDGSPSLHSAHRRPLASGAGALRRGLGFLALLMARACTTRTVSCAGSSSWATGYCTRNEHEGHVRGRLGQAHPGAAIHADRGQFPAPGTRPLRHGDAARRRPAPTPFMPAAMDLSERYAAIVRGKPVAMISETLLGIPSTAHILGGACMGAIPPKG